MREQQTSLSSWFNGFFIAKRAEGFSQDTVQDYSRAFRHLQARHPDPTVLTTAHLRAFLAEMQGRQSSKSVYNLWAALRSFYKWHSLETGQPNPMLPIPAPKTVEPVIEPLTQAQVEAIMKAAEYGQRRARPGQRTYQPRRPTGLRDRAMILVMLDCGLRASELCRLEVQDVELDTGRVHVRLGKGGKGRLVWLGKHTRRALWRYMILRDAKSGPLFVTQTDKPLDRNMLRQVLVRIGVRAGVNGLHPHQLRHTFATEFLKNGGNLLALQRLLGHSSLEMVRRYARIAEADLARLHETGSPVDKWRL